MQVVLHLKVCLNTIQQLGNSPKHYMTHQKLVFPHLSVRRLFFFCTRQINFTPSQSDEFRAEAATLILKLQQKEEESSNKNERPCVFIDFLDHLWKQFYCWKLVMCRARAQDRPPARPKAFLLGSSPPEARKPEARTSLTKTPKILCSCMYINTRLPARPKQILHYPNPPEARNLKKRQARVRPKPENLRLAHH